MVLASLEAILLTTHKRHAYETSIHYLTHHAMPEYPHTGWHSPDLRPEHHLIGQRYHTIYSF